MAETVRRRRRSKTPPVTSPEKISPLVWGAAALGLTTAFLSFVALWEIIPLFGGWPFPPLLPLSGYYEWVTFEHLAPGRDGRVTSKNLAIAEDATNHELNLSPLAVDAWLRLAYIDSLRGPKLTSKGLDALDKSFQAARFDPINCGDRDVLALNHWSELTPSLRQHVLAEIRMTWKPPVVVHPEVIRRWRSQVTDQGGGFALLLTLGPADR